QDSAESTVRIEVDAGHAYFLDPETQPGGLDPKLKRHPPAALRDPLSRHSLAPVGLEAAKSIRETQAVTVVQLGGDLLVYVPAVLGRAGILSESAQIATARNDVHIMDCLKQDGDATRFVLAVAVHRDQDIDVLLDGVRKRGNQGRPVTAIV